MNAGLGRIDLPGARIGNLDLTTNAGMTSADLTGTSLASLSGTVNAGLLAVSLPADADVVGSLKVNAGELQVCIPSGLGVRIHRSGALSGFSTRHARSCRRGLGEPGLCVGDPPRRPDHRCESR